MNNQPPARARHPRRRLLAAFLMFVIVAGFVWRSRASADPRFVGTWVNTREGSPEPFAIVTLRSDGLAELTDSKTGVMEYFHWRIEGSTFRITNAYSGRLGALGPVWESAVSTVRRNANRYSGFELLEVSNDSFSIQQTPKTPPIRFDRLRDQRAGID